MLYQACLVFQRLPRGASFRLQEARTRDQDRDAGAGVVRVPVGRGNEGKVRAVAQHAAAQSLDAVDALCLVLL